MQNFTYSIPTKVYFGKGQVENLGAAVKAYGQKALLVYGGSSIKRTGLYDKVVQQLKDNGVQWVEQPGVEPNPRIETVRAGAQKCRENGVDVVLAVGGGSTIDASKAIAYAANYDGDAWDFIVNPSLIEADKVLPIVTVLTLAATGSEMDAGGVVTNGMSAFARDGENANAALLCSVTPEDFGAGDVLAGVEFQRRYERLAFALGGGRYRAPAQTVGDFLDGRASTSLGRVAPSYRPGVELADLAGCLPGFAVEAMREALRLFDRRLRGYADEDAVLTGVETRSSSPVRVKRGEDLQSNLRGLYPCGEGAGYAGGIMSAAVDGLRCAIALAARYGG